MADKTIGELTNSAITSADDVLVFENSDGETKNVKVSQLFGRNNLTSPWGNRGFILKDYLTGDIGNYSFPAMIAQIFMSTVVAGTGISITGQSTAEGFVPTISCTVQSSGTTWYFGNTAPTGAESGDYWLRTDTDHYGDVDTYDGSSWSNVGTFAGRDGQDGQDGETPTIDSVSKHWIIGQTDTGVVAEGQDGADGQAATIAVGTVTTGAAGTNASVTNSGTSSAAVFDFVIPRGADGSSGSGIKSFTYTGTGVVNHTVTFPELPTMVLAIHGEHTFGGNTWSVSTRPFAWGVRPVYSDWCAIGATSNGNQMMPASYNNTDFEVTFSGMTISDPGASLNAQGVVYTVLYL